MENLASPESPQARPLPLLVIETNAPTRASPSMPRNDDFQLNPAELFHTLRTYVKWWAVPAVACAAIAAAYSLVAPRDWRATQTLTLRPDAASISVQQLGKFADLSEMKMQQATILELAKSQSVVEATLKTVGPPPSWFATSSNWPTERDVEDFRKQVDLRPPGGAEFGHTEVFYLSVCDTNRERAAAMVAALIDQLELANAEPPRRSGQEHDGRARENRGDGRAGPRRPHGKIGQVRGSIGADLAELRSLNASTGNQSEVSRKCRRSTANGGATTPGATRKPATASRCSRQPNRIRPS